MNKYKCGKCEHETDVKGYCPTDGSELVEQKSTEKSAEERLQDAISKIGEVVGQKVGEAMKQYQPANKDIHKMPTNHSERYEYVKGLLEDHDKSYMGGLSTDEKKAEFLGKARIAHFFKNLVRFNLTKDPAYLEHVKALAEGVDADGGYMVPPEFRATLVEDLKDPSFLRSLVTVFPMRGNSLELPTLASGVQVSWGSENTAISTTTARFGTLTFSPYRMNSMIYTSRELVNDSSIGVVQLLSRLFREAVGREEDRVIINGSGSGQPKGILQETLSGIDNANVDADLAANIRRLPFRLNTSYRRNGKWLINSRSMGHIAALQDSNGQFLYKEGIEGLTPARLVGYQVHEENNVPLDTLIFGDLSWYYLADREQITVETTTEGAGTFEKHQVAIKVVERIDGKVAQTLAFRTLTNAGID